MAQCNYCGLDMLEADGCVDDPIIIETQTYEPIRHGAELRFPGRWTPTRRCHDCNALPGQVHHHGCDMEECPACGDQSISCDCRWAGEESEDAFRWYDGAEARTRSEEHA